MEKTILITGSTKGIGLATAIHLHRIGYNVVGVARNKFHGVFPGELYLADLGNAEETDLIFNKILHNHCINGVINNVGFAKPQLLEELELTDFYSVLDINLRPVIQVAKIFTPGMKERRWGRVLNIASRAALGKVGCSSYTTAKAGVIGLTRTLALELAKDGITVNAIAPGPINTDQFFTNHPKGGEREKHVMPGIPLGRVGEPDEIAYAIEFFLNEKSGFITGQTLFIDGGGSI